jgi:hypothetical protein
MPKDEADRRRVEPRVRAATVKDHEEAVAHFTIEAKRATNAELKAYSAKILPILGIERLTGPLEGLTLMGLLPKRALAHGALLEDPAREPDERPWTGPRASAEVWNKWHASPTDYDRL